MLFLEHSLSEAEERSIRSLLDRALAKLKSKSKVKPSVDKTKEDLHVQQEEEEADEEEEAVEEDEQEEDKKHEAFEEEEAVEVVEEDEQAEDKEDKQEDEKVSRPPTVGRRESPESHRQRKKLVAVKRQRTPSSTRSKGDGTSTVGHDEGMTRRSKRIKSQ